MCIPLKNTGSPIILSPYVFILYSVIWLFSFAILDSFSISILGLVNPIYCGEDAIMSIYMSFLKYCLEFVYLVISTQYSHHV